MSLCLIGWWFCRPSKNNQGLSSLKTVIAPKSTTVLGWVWQNGSLRASPTTLLQFPQLNPTKLCMPYAPSLARIRSGVTYSKVMRSKCSLWTGRSQGSNRMITSHGHRSCWKPSVQPNMLWMIARSLPCPTHQIHCVLWQTLLSRRVVCELLCMCYMTTSYI